MTLGDSISRERTDSRSAVLMLLKDMDTVRG